MTLFLVDISRYQAGLSIAEVKKEGFAAVLARASTGYEGGSKDAQFATFKSQAAKAGILFAAYHFLYPANQVSVAHQADVCAAAIGDTSIPVMIDHEPDGSGAPTPSVAAAVDFAGEMRDRGYTVPLWYLPHWVWSDHLHSPALPKTAGLQLVASSYVSGSGAASALYPGDSHWPATYGGLTPVIWQFTDAAKVAGQSVDANAYRGTQAELEALLSASTEDDVTKEDLIAWLGDKTVAQAFIKALAMTDGVLPVPSYVAQATPGNPEWQWNTFFTQDWSALHDPTVPTGLPAAHAKIDALTAAVGKLADPTAFAAALAGPLVTALEAAGGGELTEAQVQEAAEAALRHVLGGLAS